MVNDNKRIVSEASDIAWKKAKKIPTEHGYFVEASDMDADEGGLWCHSCAEKVVKKLKKKHPGKNIYVAREHYFVDDCEHCDDCGCRLDATLSEYRMEQELDHFDTYDFDLTDPNECHQLLLIFDEDKYLEYDDLQGRIEALAERVVKRDIVNNMLGICAKQKRRGIDAL